MAEHGYNKAGSDSSSLYGDSEPESSKHRPGALKRKAEDQPESITKRAKHETPPSHTRPSSLRPCARLPPEIWQHVFQYLEPVMLGRLIQVNSLFRTYLLEIPQSIPSKSSFEILRSESIWAISRNKHFPQMGKPPGDLSELELWKMVRGKRCQFCGRIDTRPSNRDDAFEGGPGVNGVRIIWPFGILSCGNCLEHRTQKEIDLMLSPDAALLPALPYVFATRNWHYVPSSTLRQLSAVPIDQQLTKVYFTPHLERFRAELRGAQYLGAPAAKEWVKGLEMTGQKTRLEAEKWERWEASGQLDVVRRIPHPSQESIGGFHTRHQSAATPKMGSLRANWSVSPQYIPSIAEVGDLADLFPRHGSARNLKDANEAKAIRRSEIEDRCKQLHPPIQPEVLRHIDAFQAAIKISTHLTEDAWDVLRPRLEAGRESAERTEAKIHHGETTLSDDGLLDLAGKRSKDADREWEEEQAPIYARLTDYADQLLHSDWANGELITKENVANFVAQALVGIRRRFYSGQRTRDFDNGPQSGPSACNSEGRNLVLGHMKWIFNYVFDNHIKTRVQGVTKELFLCNGCGVSSRPYAFEGLILHFGAKHTGAFSVGNTVVSWKTAEWPEEPPFNPYPGSIISPRGHPARPVPTPRHMSNHSRQGRHPRRTPATPHGFPEGPFPLPPSMPAAPQQGPPFPMSFGPPMEMVSNPNLAGTTEPLPLPMPLPLPLQSVGTSVGTGANQVPPAKEPEEKPPLQSSSEHDRQVQEAANIAMYYWHSMAKVHPIPSAIRISIIFVYLIREFRRRFESMLSLAVFEDALFTQGTMAAMKDAPGLVCCVCEARARSLPGPNGLKEESDVPEASSFARPALETPIPQYTFGSLVSHSTNFHGDLLSSITPRSGAGSLSLPAQVWMDRFLKRPSQEELTSLMRAARMDARERNIIEGAFPDLLPAPVPGPAQEQGRPHGGGSRFGQNLSDAGASWARPHSSGSPSKPMEGQNRVSPSGARGPHSTHREDSVRFPRRDVALERPITSSFRGRYDEHSSYYEPDDEAMPDPMYFEPPDGPIPPRRRPEYRGHIPSDHGYERRVGPSYMRERYDEYMDPPPVRRRPPQYVQPRYRRYMRVSQAIPRFDGQEMVRSSSRYGRYDAQRRRIERETSERRDPSVRRSVRPSTELSPGPSVDNERFSARSPGPSRQQSTSVNRARSPAMPSPAPPSATPVFDPSGTPAFEHPPEDRVRYMYPTETYSPRRYMPAMYHGHDVEDGYEYDDYEPMVHPDEIHHFAESLGSRYMERRRDMAGDEHDYYVHR